MTWSRVGKILTVTFFATSIVVGYSIDARKKQSTEKTYVVSFAPTETKEETLVKREMREDVAAMITPYMELKDMSVGDPRYKELAIDLATNTVNFFNRLDWYCSVTSDTVVHRLCRTGKEHLGAVIEQTFHSDHVRLSVINDMYAIIPVSMRGQVEMEAQKRSNTDNRFYFVPPFIDPEIDADAPPNPDNVKYATKDTALAGRGGN